MEREVLTKEDQAIWRHALEWCEEQMIQTFQSVGITARTKSVKQQLENFLPKSGRLTNLMEFLAEEDKEPTQEVELPEVSVASLRGYMERLEVEPGDYLIRQGTATQGFYFVETGQLTMQVEDESHRAIRLRKMGAGTVVGEEGTYLGSEATASVIADQPSTVYYLSTASLRQMEATDPKIAAALHKFIAQLLSERLARSSATLHALLE